ncbi:MAG: hypothetical protein ACQETE_14010 [Bacteroidota bacterium]
MSLKSDNSNISNKNKVWWGIFGGGSLLSIIYLFRGFFQLLSGERLPVDLALRWWRFQRLIVEQENIYLTISDAAYPPSSYALMGPFLGWYPYNIVDEIWALVNIIALIFSGYIVYKLIEEKGIAYQISLLAIPLFLSFQSLGMVLGVGQITILYVSLLLLVVYIGYAQPFNKWINLLVSSILLAISMGKFSLIIPICFVFLFDKRFRGILFGAVGINVLISWYIAIQLETTIWAIIADIYQNTKEIVALGSIDVHSMLHHLGISPDYSAFVSLLFLLLLVHFLISLQKNNTIFLKLAIAAIIARFWTYHAHYDNIVLVFLLIYAFQQLDMVSQFTWIDLLDAKILWVLLIWLSLAIPARFLTADPPFYGVFLGFQVIIWLGSALLLIKRGYDLKALAP